MGRSHSGLKQALQLAGGLAAMQGPGSGRAVLAWNSCMLSLPCLCRWRQPGLQILRAVLKGLGFILGWHCSSQSCVREK